ncbi:MAG: hypothetical protein AB1468_04460 [Candidatus Micrarchaeota archaeon]
MMTKVFLQSSGWPFAGEILVNELGRWGCEVIEAGDWKQSHPDVIVLGREFSERDMQVLTEIENIRKENKEIPIIAVLWERKIALSVEEMKKIPLSLRADEKFEKLKHCAKNNVEKREWGPTILRIIRGDDRCNSVEDNEIAIDLVIRQLEKLELLKESKPKMMPRILNIDMGCSWLAELIRDKLNRRGCEVIGANPDKPFQFIEGLSWFEGNRWFGSGWRKNKDLKEALKKINPDLIVVTSDCEISEISPFSISHNNEDFKFIANIRSSDERIPLILILQEKTQIEMAMKWVEVRDSLTSLLKDEGVKIRESLESLLKFEEVDDAGKRKRSPITVAKILGGRMLVATGACGDFWKDPSTESKERTINALFKELDELKLLQPKEKKKTNDLLGGSGLQNQIGELPQFWKRPKSEKHHLHNPFEGRLHKRSAWLT